MRIQTNQADGSRLTGLLHFSNIRLTLILALTATLCAALSNSQTWQHSASAKTARTTRAPERPETSGKSAPGNLLSAGEYIAHEPQLPVLGSARPPAPRTSRFRRAVAEHRGDAPDGDGAQAYERVCEPRTKPGNGVAAADPPVIEGTKKTCSDTRFLIDRPDTTNPNLDSEFNTCSGDEGKSFKLNIDRYVGDRDKLIDSGFIATFARLKIGFYRKTSGQFTEGVYFNDTFVGSVTSAQGGTVTYEIPIPIGKVNFPDAPGGTGENTVTIVRGGPNDCTTITIDWMTLDIKVARPALLLHGIFSDPETWEAWTREMGGYLRQAGLPVETLDLHFIPRRIETNATEIGKEVESLRQSWKVDKINLIGHSKGGIDARHFAEKSEVISQVIQIGSPNAGSFLADIASGLLGPGVAQLSEGYMEDYNREHGHNSDVEYTALAGFYKPNRSNCSDTSTDRSGCGQAFLEDTVGEGDLFVSKQSVHSLGYTKNLTFPKSGSDDTDAIHIFQTGSRGIFDLLKSQIGKFDEPGKESPRQQAPTPAPVSAAGPRRQPSAPTSGTIHSGQQNFHTIQVDVASNVFFAMFYESGKTSDDSPQNNLDMTLVSPTGARFAAQRDDVESPGARVEVFSFGVIPTGAWRVEVTAPSVVSPSGAVSYSIIYVGDSDAADLVASFGQPHVQAGAPLKLLATLRNQTASTPITGASVRARVQIPTTPDATVQEVVLFDDGTHGDATPNNGIYSFDFPGTQQAGVYSVQFLASKEANGSFPGFSRQDIELASVSLSNSTIAGTFSDAGAAASAASASPDSGAAVTEAVAASGPPYAELVIQAGMQVSRAGSYVVLAELTDSAGNKLFASKEAALGAGAQNVALEFDGEQIYRNRVNGRFRLTSIRLMESSGGERLILDERTNVYQTASYQFLDFLTRPLSFAGTGSAAGVDTDGNGLFNQLRATLQVDAKQAGTYSGLAQLINRDGRVLGLVAGTFSLASGTNNVDFNFDGRNIRRGGVDGPYTVTGLQIQGQGVSLYASDVLTTQAFRYTDFDGCGVTLSSTGVDIPASGGSGSVGVTIDAGCPWTAVSGASWINATGGGNRNGTVNFTVAANTGAARVGTINVGGSDFTVRQAGLTCSFSLSPVSQNFAAAGGAGTFTVNAQAGCAWTAASNVSWVTTTSKGNGNGTVSFSVAANTGAARSGGIGVGGQSFSVSQSAAGAGGAPKLTAADGLPNDILANSVAVSGDTAIVGAPGDDVGTNVDQGSAYVFTRNPNGTWSQQAKLVAAGGAAGDAFGWSVAIEGNTAVVGAKLRDVGARPNQGAAYVFVRSGATWSQQAELMSPPDTSLGVVEDNFGESVAISGSRIVVGAPGFETSGLSGVLHVGAVYIFERTGVTWTRSSQQLQGHLFEKIGRSVATTNFTLQGINVSVIVAGVPDYVFAGGTFGSVEFHVFDTASSIWFRKARVTATDRAEGDKFGASVAIGSDGTTAVGSPLDDVGTNVDQGAAYVFTPSMTTAGITWTQQAKLLADDGAGSDMFGGSVGVYGATAVVGARADDINAAQNRGSAYVFGGANGVWTQRRKLLADDGVAGDEFGASVGVSGDTAVVGAPADDGQKGSAYVFSPLIPPPAPTLQFNLAAVSVNEQVRSAQLTVSRGGNAAVAVAVDYATSDGTADHRKDYAQTLGTLDFAPGETSKTVTVFITDDVLQESPETFTVTLSNPVGATLGSPASAVVTVTSDDTATGPNPVDAASFNAPFYVGQHYVDFLNREADASGLAFWTNEITSCGTNAQCKEVKKINVSAAFFLSIEFQNTGYLVYLFYKSAYGDATSPGVAGTVPVIRLEEFLPDTQRIGRNVVVGQAGWEAQIEANKQAFALEFVSRPRFASAFPGSMTPAQFVDKLRQNTGAALDATERNNLVAQLTANNTQSGRAAVVRAVAEDGALRQSERNRAFVLMQYYGYLRRNPNDAPEPTLNFAGWKFWLSKLEQFNGNFVQAEMVKAFLSSDEYRHRFGN